jgi:hypothetical protein
MTNERQIQILKLLKKNKDGYFRTGLCTLLDTLLLYKHITAREFEQTMRMMVYNKPAEKSAQGYWFPIGDWQVREEWLDKLINKLYKETTNENKLQK